MKILYSISLLPFLPLCALSEAVDIKLTPLMQTIEVGSCLFPEENIIFQVSAKSPLELFMVDQFNDSSKKSYWCVDNFKLKKDIKTGNLIFGLSWICRTKSAPKKISESIEVTYGSRKLIKETHDIIKPKGEIALDGFLLSYEISKYPDAEVVEIIFRSKQYINLHDLQILSDDNKSIGVSMEHWLPPRFDRDSIRLIGPCSFYKEYIMSSIRLKPEEVKLVKKVSFAYYPGPYKKVKVPLELTLPLK